MSTQVRVVLKLGDINKSSRTSVRVEDDMYGVDVDSVTFTKIEAAANARVTHALGRSETQATRDDKQLYLKPSLYATQREWVAINSDNMRRMFDVARHNYDRRTKGSGPFMIELFAFASRDVTTAVRRATAARVQSAARAIDDFLDTQHGVVAGDMARARWAMAHARQPEGTQLTVPETATFARMQHLDAMRAAPPQVSPEPDFRTVTVRMHGSSELQLSINVRELRDALGLPHYNLVADGIFSRFDPPLEPAEDAEEVDHMSD